MFGETLEDAAMEEKKVSGPDNSLRGMGTMRVKMGES